MEKLKVALEDRPVDVELARYKRMFEAACSALASIGDALGVEPDEGGAEPILSAIAELKTAHAHRSEQEPVYWEVRNGVCKHGVYRTKEHAEEVRFDMQKSHDLSGSLAAFNVRPLYAAPVRTKDLTDDEIEAAVLSVNTTMEAWITYRAVIAADREKNK